MRRRFFRIGNPQSAAQVDAADVVSRRAQGLGQAGEARERLNLHRRVANQEDQPPIEPSSGRRTFAPLAAEVSGRQKTREQRPGDAAHFDLAVRLRQRAAEDPAVYQEWWELQRRNMKFVEPGLRERLMECHAKVGPLSQLHDLVVIDQFDVRERISTLRPPLLLIRGLDDPGMPPEYELEIHQAVPGSHYLKLQGAGHFPMAERPQDVNGAIEELLKSLGQRLDD